MQAESGQSLDDILRRKEYERQAGEGVFFWGVGNAPSTMTSALARMGVRIPAIFSIMKSRPKPVDIAPEKVVVWRQFIDASGRAAPIPESSLVTSRADSAKGVKTHHYALVCHSERPLMLNSPAPVFDPTQYRNAGPNGGEIGNSQVTALLQRVSRGEPERGYAANLTAQLTGSYWVKLVDPIEISRDDQRMMSNFHSGTPEQWLEIVARLRFGTSTWSSSRGETTLSLF